MKKQTHPIKLAVILAIYTASALLASFAFSPSAQALQTVPYKMNFQGRLTDAAGNAKPNGTYNMKFRIYDASTGGTQQWTETRANSASTGVTVTNGLFSVQLGDVTSLPPAIFTNQNLYFEIELPTPGTATCTTASCESYTEGPMGPRNKLGTSAYAFNSDTLDGLDSTAFAAASGSANYIQNQSASPQGASFDISGTGRIGGALTAASTLSVTGAATFTGALTVNNAATFKNASNSAAAFLVQNATSVALFTVDTSASAIQIGSATTDATAVKLVLDSSSSASDPTGTGGSMYYSTSSNKFRCYENSAWKNCDTVSGTPTAKTSNYTAKDGDFVLANATAGTITITLPAPTPGATVSVKKINAANSVIVSGNGVNIDNLSSETLSTQWHSQDYFSDGTQWYRV